MKIGILGGGAVGSQAALIAAKINPQAQITVIDKQNNLGNLRTFVFLAGTYHRLLDLGIWHIYESIAHEINAVDSSFKGVFGGISLNANDCAADVIGYSFAEGQLIAKLQKELKAQQNINYLNDAKILEVTNDAKVTYQINNSKKVENFDVIAIAGITSDIIQSLGFKYRLKKYKQTVFVSTIEDQLSNHKTFERIYQTGTVTLIPRNDGYGHVFVCKENNAQNIQNYSLDEYKKYLIDNDLFVANPNKEIIEYKSYQPQLKVVENSGIGKICLLGASACNVHPIGAQELNLGIKDAFEFANLIKANQEFAHIGQAFHAARVADRQRVIRLTDTLAKLASWDSCVKLNLAGILATGININPIARKFLLKNIILN